jgi:TPR repeat protein
MNSIGRCLEYGQGIEAISMRAAKYYRMVMELKNADAINSFGICLERGSGAAANIALVAEHYRLSAENATRTAQAILDSAWSTGVAFTKIFHGWPSATNRAGSDRSVIRRGTEPSPIPAFA